MFDNVWESEVKKSLGSCESPGCYPGVLVEYYEYVCSFTTQGECTYCADDSGNEHVLYKIKWCWCEDFGPVCDCSSNSGTVDWHKIVKDGMQGITTADCPI